MHFMLTYPLTDPSLEPSVVTKVSHVRLDIAAALHCTALGSDVINFRGERRHILCVNVYIYYSIPSYLIYCIVATRN